MSEQDTVAVIGAGIVGAAVAWALAREGRRVLLLDRAAPGVAGASFGNVGHIAAELIEPLPSPALLFGFWRELYRFDGALDLPPRRVLHMLPWIGRFAAAAFKRRANTRHLAPLVRPAASSWTRWLAQIGREDLLRRHGHYEIDLGPRAAEVMRSHSDAMAKLGIRTRTMSADELRAPQRAAGAASAAGLWFEDSAHVVDPLGAVQALVTAAQGRGAAVLERKVHALVPRGTRIEIHTDQAPVLADAAVVCAGMGSTALLAPLSLRAPLQPVRGYHIELAGQPALLDAPVVYTRERVLVTPMLGRLRASSFMEFADTEAASDPRKPRALRRKVAALGYVCAPDGDSWVGARPVLPDYLPGIGRAPGAARLFYALGHQHIGLTTAPITGDLIADLVAERTPRLPVAAFDLRRFGAAGPHTAAGPP